MSDNAARASTFFWRIVAFALVVLGMADSAYLLARHFALAGGGSELFDICKAVFGGDCDAAISGDLAVQLGIPLAGWGVVYFAVLGVTLLLAYLLGETFIAVGTLAALALATLAAALGLLLSAVMLSPAAAFCPLCMGVHAVNLLLVPVIVMASGHTMREIGQSLGAGFRYLGGARAADPVIVRWKATGLLTAALVGVVAYQWILIQTDRRAAQAGSKVTFQQVWAEFEKAPRRDISLGAEDPRRGDPDAGLELVLFSDFQCPACRRFARAIARVAEGHPELAVVFKHYPLSKQCNAGLRVDLHPLSCDAAYAAEAARRQGKFWEYHDALFASDKPLEADVLRQLAEEIGLDMVRFEADVADPATKARIAGDVALGRKLKLAGTPTAFLNDKAISVQGMSFLDKLVERAPPRR